VTARKTLAACQIIAAAFCAAALLAPAQFLAAAEIPLFVLFLAVVITAAARRRKRRPPVSFPAPARGRTAKYAPRAEAQQPADPERHYQ
jgi:hypothetical protein